MQLTRDEITRLSPDERLALIAQLWDSVVRRMADNPRQFTTVFKTLSRARAKKFPYSLFFLVEPDALLVIACFHSSRDPRHWQKRL
jgi:plasmid stabilization system protein ParE